ncbi:MAG: hypothetical protein WC936_04695 [Candidatus Nanoarchaeia archaeon]
MMHTLRFEQCMTQNMLPCLEDCPKRGLLSREVRESCIFHVKTEMTYYDDTLTVTIFDNIIFDHMDPELLRDLFNKATAAQQQEGYMGQARVFGPEGHAE